MLNLIFGCFFRTAEILLELCNIDLVLDNTMDCQSKLVLICHLMGVPNPVRPTELPSGVKTPISGRPTSPVFIHANDRPRRGYQSKKVPETSVPVQQDATNRFLQVPFMNQGASPTTKVRELCSGLFPDHSTDCYCITCSSELVFVVRCSAFMIQAKLWSVLGFHNEADEEFQRGQQFVQSLCSRMRVAKANKAAVNLFNAPTQLKLQNAWNDRKVEWLQSVILSVADLILEQSIHCGAYEKCDEAMELLEQGKEFLLNFFIGPIEHRGLKTIAKLNLIRCNLTDREAEEKHLQIEDSEDEVLVLEPTSQTTLAPKTPAPSCRRMADAAPPIQKRFGRQSRPKTIDLDSPITITVINIRINHLNQFLKLEMFQNRLKMTVKMTFNSPVAGWASHSSQPCYLPANLRTRKCCLQRLRLRLRCPPSGGNQRPGRRKRKRKVPPPQRQPEEELAERSSTKKN